MGERKIVSAARTNARGPPSQQTSGRGQVLCRWQATLRRAAEEFQWE